MYFLKYRHGDVISVLTSVTSGQIITDQPNNNSNNFITVAMGCRQNVCEMQRSSWPVWQSVSDARLCLLRVWLPSFFPFPFSEVWKLRKTRERCEIDKKLQWNTSLKGDHNRIIDNRRILSAIYLPAKTLPVNFFKYGWSEKFENICDRREMSMKY